MRATEIDDLGEQLLDGLNASDRSHWEARAARLEVGQSPNEAAILAFLQGRGFAAASRRNLLWLVPVQGDFSFLRHWRLVRARAKNLKVAREGSAG